MTKLRKNFWENHKLDALRPEEWEALCDGCGKCCLLKLEDEDTDDVHYTNVACRLLDHDSCRCGQYPIRKSLVSGCVFLTPANIGKNASWMPRTCAYRLLHEGKSLYDWHPLNTGGPNSVHTAGISVRGRVVGEFDVSEDDIEDYIIEDDI